MQIAEKNLDGEFDDLDWLSVDLFDWLAVQMKTFDGQFEIALSDSTIFSETYSEPLGNLTGVMYSFFGSGKVDYLQLAEGSGDVFYQTSFED